MIVRMVNTCKNPSTYMEDYVKKYGCHFNEKLADFAISHMSSKGKQISPVTREHLEELLSSHNMEIDDKYIYDALYLANMCKADFLGSSIPDEHYMVRFIKDVLDDEDGYDGIVMHRWYADTCKKSLIIDWKEML